jgi:hypothetical protein
MVFSTLILLRDEDFPDKFRSTYIRQGRDQDRRETKYFGKCASPKMPSKAMMTATFLSFVRDVNDDNNEPFGTAELSSLLLWYLYPFTSMMLILLGLSQVKEKHIVLGATRTQLLRVSLFPVLPIKTTSNDEDQFSSV